MSIHEKIDTYMKGCKEGVNFLPREQKQVDLCLLVLEHIAVEHNNIPARRVIDIIYNWERKIGLKRFKITIKREGHESEHGIWATDSKAAIEQAKKSVCTFKEYVISAEEG